MVTIHYYYIVTAFNGIIVNKEQNVTVCSHIVKRQMRFQNKNTGNRSTKSYILYFNDFSGLRNIKDYLPVKISL